MMSSAPLRFHLQLVRPLTADLLTSSYPWRIHRRHTHARHVAGSSMLNYRRVGILSALTLGLTLAACGGGGGSGSVGDEDGGGSLEAGFEVTVVVTGEGEVVPPEQQVAEGEQAVITLAADEGFQLGEVSGCAGTLEGMQYTTGPVTTSCQVMVTFIPLASVSGQVLPAPATAVDATLNDLQAPQVSNNRCEDAQALETGTELHGFASAEGTGGDPDHERFASQADTADFYRVNLNAGQMVELEVADHSDGANTLELHLWNHDCSQKADSADSGGETLRVSSLLGGEHVVEVRAQQGISKYILRPTEAWNSQASAAELQALAQALPSFPTYELIIELEQGSVAQDYADVDAALRNSAILTLTFSHTDPTRATLAQVTPVAGVTVGELVPVMAQLELLDAEAFAVIDTLRVGRLLQQLAQVKQAEPNYHMESQRTPNDSHYSSQWHFEDIALPQAWDTTTGAPADGSEIRVAALDTGVYLTHEDLQGQLIAGYDFHDDDPDPDDANSSGESSWHGTHVAGTVAAAADNDTGVASVAWAAKVMPVRVLGADGGTRYDVMQGVRYAAAMVNDSGSVPDEPVDVINMSLGGGGHSDIEQNLYHEVRGRGVVIVAAAGNDNTDQPFYPAAYNGVVSVSATNCQGERAPYSNYGSTISVAAPGGDTGTCGLMLNGRVLSTMGAGSHDSRTSEYGWLMGTSMAAPHVAGVVALMRAVYPGLTPEDFDALLADGQLTDDLGDPGKDADYGYGRINAQKAVQAAEQQASDPAPAARVVAEPAAVYLGHMSEGDVTLTKEGSGEAPTVAGFTGEAEWLTVNAQDVDSQGLGEYQLLVDRGVFDEDATGHHESQALFTLEDESTVAVPVSIQVGHAREAAPVYVLLLDAETEQPVHETLATWTDSGELTYTLDNVAAGDYYLLAGSDIDVDGFMCQAGEICGAYPNQAERELIAVGSEPLQDMDVPVDIRSQLRTFAGERVPRP